jgi:hypothetical protein
MSNFTCVTGWMNKETKSNQTNKVIYYVMCTVRAKVLGVMEEDPYHIPKINTYEVFISIFRVTWSQVELIRLFLIR